MVLAVGASAARTGLWRLGTVPYSQSTSRSPTGHRDDCSGYVSMILGLPAPGLSTVGLRDLVDPIPASQVRRGDLLGNLGAGTEGDAGHVQWVDNVSATGSVTVYEQTGGSAGPHRNTYKRPGFPAWRLRGVAAPDPSPSGDDDMPLQFRRVNSYAAPAGSVNLSGAYVILAGTTWCHLGTEQALGCARRLWGWVGVEPQALDIADLLSGGCGAQVPFAVPASGTGGLNAQQVEDAAFAGAQRAERE